MLGRTGDLGSAATATARAFLREGNELSARTLAQVLRQQTGSVRQVGEICMAMTAVAAELPVTAELPSTAWGLFTGAELGEVLRLAPAEYLRTGFGQDRARATAALAGLLAGEYRTEADAVAWFDIAATSLLAGQAELSRAAFERALAGLDRITDVTARDRLRADAKWLRPWYGRGGEVPESHLPAIGVLGYRGPDRAASSRNLGEYLESLATLAPLIAHRDFAAATDDQDNQFAPVVEALRARIGAAARPGPATVRLFAVDRDASAWAEVPKSSWVLYTGRLPQPLFGVRRDLPLDRRLRPLFVSVHVDSARALTATAIGYLRQHAPIGCRDWSTVLLLQAAGVPTFFAGSVTTTLGRLAPGPTRPAPEHWPSMYPPAAIPPSPKRAPWYAAGTWRATYARPSSTWTPWPRRAGCVPAGCRATSPRGR